MQSPIVSKTFPVITEIQLVWNNSFPLQPINKTFPRHTLTSYMTFLHFSTICGLPVMLFFSGSLSFHSHGWHPTPGPPSSLPALSLVIFLLSSVIDPRIIIWTWSPPIKEISNLQILFSEHLPSRLSHWKCQPINPFVFHQPLNGPSDFSCPYFSLHPQTIIIITFKIIVYYYNHYFANSFIYNPCLFLLLN